MATRSLKVRAAPECLIACATVSCCLCVADPGGKTPKPAESKITATNRGIHQRRFELLVAIPAVYRRAAG